MAERVEDRGRHFFDQLEPRRRGTGEERARVTAEALADVQEPGRALIGVLDGLEASIQLLKEAPSDPRRRGAAGDPRRSAVDRVARRGESAPELTMLLRASDPDYVFFLELRHRGVFLRAAPIDVSQIVRENLLERFATTVLTSATLTVEGTFDYLRGRLGIRRATEIRLASEFDFRRQAVLYLPRRMPSPKEAGLCRRRRARVPGAAAVLRGARVRALHQLRDAAGRGAGAAPTTLDYPMLVQGRAPRSALLAEFRQTPHAVLLATSSFWQGVDVVGDALSCVIIDKLPFASPGDPMTSARMEAMTDQGADPFADYQVPLAILTLLQGLGRLIRHRQDRGVLAVLDPRLRTMGYGRRFLASLPPAPITHDLDAVRRFFAAGNRQLGSRLGRFRLHSAS